MRVDDLQAKEFVVTEDGKPQRIALCHDKLPLSVVLLFDLTVTVRPVLKPLAEGALEILGHLKPEDKMAIMGFSTRTELLKDPFIAAADVAPLIFIFGRPHRRHQPLLPHHRWTGAQD